MKFAAIIDYSLENPKLADVRPVHREYLRKLLDAGKLMVSGPLTDGGALIIYEAESKEEADKLVREDPFTTGGVFTSWVIRPWNPIMANPSMLPK